MGGIEVVHPQSRTRGDDPGIQVVPDSEKEVSLIGDPIYVSGPGRPNGVGEDGLKSPSRTICGLKPTLFWTLFAIALLVVIGAAVGGGVGGTRANRQTSEPSQTTYAMISSQTLLF